MLYFTVALGSDPSQFLPAVCTFDFCPRMMDYDGLNNNNDNRQIAITINIDMMMLRTTSCNDNNSNDDHNNERELKTGK